MKPTLVIVNKVIPFKGFVAINLFGVVFVREELWPKQTDLQKTVILVHESIHTAQMRELLWLFFYIIYALEWIFFLIKYGNFYKAYCNVSFEREAQRHELNPLYENTRKSYAQWRRQ